MRGGEGNWLFAVSAVMALAVAGLIYFLFVAHAPEGREASPAPVDQATRTAAAVPAKAAPLSDLADDETVLCGFGRVKQTEVDEIRNKAGEAADRTLSKLKAKLAASRDPHEAALGLYMQQSTEELVKLASASRDPQVYSLAFLSCHYAGGGACDLLSAEQWATIEPDNGIPWLLMASAASARRDRVARDQAIYHAAAARRFDARLPDLLGMLQWPEIQSQAPQTRSSLADQLTAAQMSLPMISYMPFIQFCSESSSAYEDRTICGNLASLLLENRTLLGFSTGVRLAELAGWGPDEVKALREKKTEYQSALTAVLQERDKFSSDCEDLAAFDRWAANYSRLGDRGVAMRFIGESRSSADGLKRRQ